MSLWRHTLFPVLASAVVFCGCSARHYRKSADKEAYQVIDAKSVAVTNMDPAFTIEQTNVLAMDSLPITTNAPDFLGPDGKREVGARVLSLEEALLLSVRSSRDYQTEKERLYLSALGLTLARHRFTPIFSSSAEVAHRVDWLTDDRQVVADPVVTNAVFVRSRDVNRPINKAEVRFGMSWLIRDIGHITTDFTIDALRLVIGDRSVATSSRVGARFTRPLLRNAGFKAEMETLTQEERDLVYALRAFVQFRKTFCVQTARDYYAVLGQRDITRNIYLNWESSRKNAERSRALAKEGRITQSDLGRLEQQELSAESSWINAVSAYERLLDEFKLSLGLSVSSNLVLDDRELESLQILDPAIGVEDSIQVALAARMDYLNALDSYEDALRRVSVAESFLKPQLDFSAGAGLASDPNSGRLVALPEGTRYSWDAGFFFDPGLDRKAERNAYLRAVIDRNRAARDIDLTADKVRVQVRDSWRDLDQAKRSYEIAEIGVDLSERRVEEQTILAELGRAKAQDQVDAQNALNDSKNDRTRAIVAHTLSRLEFWNRLGILFIKQNGQWEETKDVASTKTH